MACSSIRYVATGFLDNQPHRNSRFNFNHLNSLPIPKLSVKSPFTRISTALTATAYAVSVSDCPVSRSKSLVDDEEYDRTYYDNVSEKIDEWMRNSVTEIVRNIKQAPLLVQIYGDGVVKTEKAVKKDWPDVVNGRPSSPDGIILVEELRDEVDVDVDDSGGDEEEGSKAFGVVIQGKFKGRDRIKSACYLLKTCRVNGGLGMGPFCTHFCLMKVRSFSKSAAAQLNDCWLLPSRI